MDTLAIPIADADISGWIQPDGSLKSPNGTVLWQTHRRVVHLDGNFYADRLRAIVNHMEANGTHMLSMVVRHDDNGQIVMVAENLPREDAEAVRDTLEARAHKQWFVALDYRAGTRDEVFADHVAQYKRSP